MRLIKMELRGFKSFADKTTLAFGKGITGIVGPNGSGKSNISDAVRWVLGEQNVRNLRGQKAEDIIFSGTEVRRPQGVAEVSLYFDNSDRALDIDFLEVVITRRLFRSGDSEFYINKRPCRLKEIHQLFADTGIGRDSMAVIGQNKIDAILNSRPEERRLIFEEVSGISRYKNRKLEALRKIEETERNLERIEDMHRVLLEQLEPLAASAERTKEFNELDKERCAYKGTLVLQKLRNAERMLTKLENENIILVDSKTAFMTELRQAEASREELLLSMEQEGTMLRTLENECSEALREQERLGSRREQVQEQLSERQKQQGRLRETLEFLKKKINTVEKERELLRSRQEDKKREGDTIRTGQIMAEELYAKAAAAEQQATLALQEQTEDQREREQAVFHLTSQISQLTEVRQQRQAEIVTVQKDMNRWDVELLELRNKSAIQQEKLRDYNQAAVALQESANVYGQRLGEIDAVYGEGQADLAQLEQQSGELTQRVHMLKLMDKDGEGFTRATKEILKSTEPWRQAVEGAVASLCRVPAQLVSAIDIALGGAAQFMVIQTEQAAKEAIYYLKKKKAGRATFLPLDTIRGKIPSMEEKKAAKIDGILGFADELITMKPLYKTIFSSLIGRVLIAENLEVATAVAKAYGHRLRIVTLDGAQLNPGGSLSGGSLRAHETSVVGRRALLDTQKQILQNLVVKRDGKRQEIALLREQWEKAKQAVAGLEDKRRSLEWQIKDETRQAESLKKETERLIGLSEALHQRQKERRLQCEQAEDQCGRLQVELQQWRSMPELTVDKLEKQQQQCIQAKEQAQQLLTEKKIMAATQREQQIHLTQQLEEKNASLEQVREEIDKQHHADEQLVADEKAASASIDNLSQSILRQEQVVKSKQVAREQFYKEKEGKFRENQELDELMKSLQHKLEQAQHQLVDQESRLSKYRYEVVNGEAELSTQGLTRETALAVRKEGSLVELTEILVDLQVKIEVLGPINPNAIKEYEQAQARQEFLQKQSSDLVGAKEQLGKVIAAVDKAMTKQFKEAFADISIHFQRIFSQLFGGGQATLALSEEKDILEAGVDIYIQPPGKKRQQLSLLSGGERALTVIALLFAFLAYRPAPFCLVDEVDAALDEANVERFSNYLQNYCDDTQFIVVTHRRKTMEGATVLQGVTMIEKGVSKLITVKFEDVLEDE